MHVYIFPGLESGILTRITCICIRLHTLLLFITAVPNTVRVAAYHVRACILPRKVKAEEVPSTSLRFIACIEECLIKDDSNIATPCPTFPNVPRCIA